MGSNLLTRALLSQQVVDTYTATHGLVMVGTGDTIVDEPGEDVPDGRLTGFEAP